MPKKPTIVKKQKKIEHKSIKDFQSKYGGDFKSKGERRFALGKAITKESEKVSAQISEIEQRLGQKLDSQHGILVALIDRVRSVDNEIIRQDTLLKTILGVPQLMHTDRLAKANRDDQRKD